MKRILGLVLLLSTACAAQRPASEGYSPTLPFGIPSHSTQAPANVGNGLPCTGPGTRYDDSWYRYPGYSGGAGFNYNARVRDGVPGYGLRSTAGGDLPGYAKPKAGGTLPGYNQPAR